MKTKFVAAALAALTIVGGVVATTQDAQARHRGAAIGLGIAGGLLVGAAIADAHAGPVYRRCNWVRQYDAFGRYAGRVHVCRTYR
jgi:hypothetical protein